MSGLIYRMRRRRGRKPQDQTDRGRPATPGHKACMHEAPVNQLARRLCERHTTTSGSTGSQSTQWQKHGGRRPIRRADVHAAGHDAPTHLRRFHRDQQVRVAPAPSERLWNRRESKTPEDHRRGRAHGGWREPGAKRAMTRRHMLRIVDPRRTPSREEVASRAMIRAIYEMDQTTGAEEPPWRRRET